ncbi:MAG: HEPN domain-containing protein [Candidatus Sumerlaeota bacterium]|nr:HEPN domain-containing protein [Candidatus Sumerlaeota bacterium]
MDVERQIEYWRDGSDDDAEAVLALFEKKKIQQGLFFAHLTLEKMLKAHVTKHTCEIPPKIHNLMRLAEISKVPLSPEQIEFLKEFDEYNREGRYPAPTKTVIDLQTARKDMKKAEEIRLWLKSLLQTS